MMKKYLILEMLLLATSALGRGSKWAFKTIIEHVLQKIAIISVVSVAAVIFTAVPGEMGFAETIKEVSSQFVSQFKKAFEIITY